MADSQIGNVYWGFVNKSRVQGGNVAGVASTSNYSSISALKARLTAISATSYSAARLATMTVNDMVYAVRLNDDAGTI